MKRPLFASTLVAILFGPRLTATAQTASSCAETAADVTRLADLGWEAMRASRLEDADADFHAALARCPRSRLALGGRPLPEEEFARAR